MIIARQQQGMLREMLETFPVVAVIGARQVGKSTLVQQPDIAKGRVYYTLDDLTILDLAQHDPATLIHRSQRLTLDEVQRQPRVLAAIKKAVDEDRVNGRFLITGSADLGFLAEIAKWLSGRVGILHLHPLSWRELSGQAASRPAWMTVFNETKLENISAVLQEAGPIPPFETNRLFTGGYPPAVLAADAIHRRLWFSAFKQTYLEREIRQLINIDHLTDFNRFLQTAAYATGQLLHQAAISRELGIPASTLSRYFTLLEATFHILRLPPYFANIGKRMVKTPKLFWTDTGFCAHLAGLSDWAQAQQANRAGFLLETGVIMEIRKHLDTWKPDAELYFVRSHDGLEVDGLIKTGLLLYPFEVKAAASLKSDDIRALKAFMDKERACTTGLVFYLGREVLPLSPRILAIPISLLCQE